MTTPSPICADCRKPRGGFLASDGRTEICFDCSVASIRKSMPGTSLRDAQAMADEWRVPVWIPDDARSDYEVRR